VDNFVTHFRLTNSAKSFPYLIVDNMLTNMIYAQHVIHEGLVNLLSRLKEQVVNKQKWKNFFLI
jgi:fructose-bisphosphate aldolase class 1